MAHAFRLPELGEGIDEAEVLRWLAREGDEVEAGVPLVEIHTDKATLEVPASASGTLLQVVVGEGAIVSVGAVLGVIGAAGEQLLYAVDAPPATEPSARPSVVVVPDPPLTLPGARAREGHTRLPLRGVRRAIVEQVGRAHREVPAVTYVEECDVTDLPAEELLPAVVEAVAASLRDHPELNARVERNAIVLLDGIHVGVTVETDDGVVVPVVRDAPAVGRGELRRELTRLIDGARAGSLGPDELRGSTFTVTVGGRLGGVLMTPLVNHPEVAILAVHRPVERVVVREGGTAVRTIANMSVTFDHRALDAPAAAAFCLDVIARLEGSHASGRP